MKSLHLQQLLYSSFLLTVVLAVPVAAQTVKTETNPASKNALPTGNELEKATILPLFTLPESSSKSVSPTVTPSKIAEAISPLGLHETIASTPKETQLPTQTADAVTPTGATQTLPTENPNALITETGSMDQVTNVSQLRDVVPSDWAYEALRSLVERYGCIAGYPDGTFRGNRAMSRFEFAAGLNACLAQIERLIASSTGGFATKEDLARIQRLREEFAAELTTIAGRVDKLEGRTSILEGRQFSTTTKLFGQAIVGMQGRTENKAPIFGVKVPDPDTNINLITNVQLSLLTQFSPRSILLTGLQAGSGRTSSFDPNSLNPTFKRLSYEGDTGNSFFLSDLTYRQLIGNNFSFIVGPAGVNAVNVFRGANRVESAGFGPISAFAQRNPIINIGAGSAGVGFDWQIVPRVSLQAVYSTDSAQDPGSGGIFGGRTGRTAAGVQLAFAPIDSVDIALNYINSYSPSSTFGLLGTGIGDDQITVNAPLKTNAFGGTLSWRVTPRFIVGGWFGYTDSKIPGRSGNAETINWMGFLNFPDLLGRGNLAGIYVGQPPKITSSSFPVGFNIPSLLTDGNGDRGGQPGTTTHVEAFYRFRISDNISVTPGVVVLFNPGHNSASDTVTIGALRTTFTF